MRLKHSLVAINFTHASGFVAIDPNVVMKVDQSDNVMCAYYADQALQHARRVPHDMAAQQTAQYWARQLAAQQLKIQQGIGAMPAPAAQPTAVGASVPSMGSRMPNPFAIGEATRLSAAQQTTTH